MIITAEIASLYRRAIDGRVPGEGHRPQPVYASATLRPGLPDILPREKEEALKKSAETRRHEADYLEERANRRRNERQTDADAQAQGDRRKNAQPVVIDTRIRRSRRQADLAAVIDFEI